MSDPIPEFKNKFDITDYQDILPRLHDKGGYLEYDEILNADNHQKGNIDLCVWQRHIPTQAEINSHEWRTNEARRILKSGVYICIKHEIIWLPPPYYTALQYGTAGSDALEFRLKRLKHVYFKIRARNNPGCLGTLTMKNRGDGETTMAITDAFWECLDGNMEVGQIGLQSKTRNDAKNPCWGYVQTLWQHLPKWFKNDFCSDFASGDNIAEKMEWMRAADENTGVKARNVLFTFYPSGTPMDGKHNVKKCILDEINKWEECSFYNTFTNYKKFIMPGFQRRGMFDMFSTPADKDVKSNAEVYELWKDSDTNEINPKTGTTKSRIHRYFSNPLEGIHGSYDRWGDADPNDIYDKIMEERENTPKNKRFAEIRGFPLNEKEMFETFDKSDFWDNDEGINARKLFLVGTRLKDERTKEPKVLYGNLEWKDGVKDSDVVFRQSDKREFDVNVARFCITDIPHFSVPLKRGEVKIGYEYDERPLVPKIVQEVLGVDSVDKRRPGKNASEVGMVNYKFLDLEESGLVKYPNLIYSSRPNPVEIAYEDAIKAAVFRRSMVQVESLNANIINWFEDRGYLSWLISKIGMPKNSLQKGDAPSGKNSAFIDEIISLINANTNVPNPLIPDDPYLLERHWFYELLDDISKFNRDDTHSNHLTMAFGQALIASIKLTKKARHSSEGTKLLLQAMFSHN